MSSMKENTSMVTDMLNVMGFDYQGFCEAMSHEHRSLQENFTFLCVEWLKKCGSEDYAFDERNEFSHIIGKKFKEKVDY